MAVRPLDWVQRSTSISLIPYTHPLHDKRQGKSRFCEAKYPNGIVFQSMQGFPVHRSYCFSDLFRSSAYHFNPSISNSQQSLFHLPLLQAFSKRELLMTLALIQHWLSPTFRESLHWVNWFPVKWTDASPKLTDSAELCLQLAVTALTPPKHSFKFLLSSHF